jgi:SAM-dependent methyltransferase
MMNFEQYYKYKNDLASGKRLVLFGASSCAYMTIVEHSIKGIYFFCDNDEKKWGTKVFGAEVCSPNRLIEEKEKVIVLITSEFEAEIREQVYEMNFNGNVYSYSMFQPREVPLKAKQAIWQLLQNYDFETVLDLGAGEGMHSEIFLEKGKKVTAIVAYAENAMPKDLKDRLKFIVADYLEYKFDEEFDCIWASHILEHQRNVGLFLDKVYSDLKAGGIFAVTVPPAEKLAGGGHGNYFTAGYLICHLIASGFDLTDMKIGEYGYNLSVICNKQTNERTSRIICAKLFFIL